MLSPCPTGVKLGAYLGRIYDPAYAFWPGIESSDGAKVVESEKREYAAAEGPPSEEREEFRKQPCPRRERTIHPNHAK